MQTQRDRELGADVRQVDIRQVDIRQVVIGGVRTLVAGRPEVGELVLVPGLGALGYLLPTVRAVARQGWRCTLLDLPGFGTSGPWACPPTVSGIADAVVRWCADRAIDAPLVVMGHSTGAQAALQATVTLQDLRSVRGLVLAGPTVAPRQRALARLVAVGPLAYRRDSPRELAVLGDYWRAGPALVTMLRSAVQDRPEVRVRRLRVPLTVTAGRQDAFAPAGWLAQLARAARTGGAPVRVIRLPGSHNNPFTHPEAVTLAVLATGAEPPAVG